MGIALKQDVCGAKHHYIKRKEITMKKIKVNYVSQIEEELEAIGATPTQARVIGGVMRGVAGDVMNKRKGDVIRFCVNDNKYKLTLEKEN